MYTDSLASRGTISRRARQRYAESLRALRVCLEDLERRFQSETICASIVLQLCELLASADNGRWNQLLHGTKTLIQNCDIVRFRQPFERTILESQRAFFIMQDMNSRQPCFLAQPPWREFLREVGDWPTASRAFTLRSKLCDWLVDAPVLLERVTETMRNGGHQAQCEILGRQATVIHDQIDLWYITEVVPMIQSAFGLGEKDAPLDSPPELYPPLEYP
ncbi:hypothetical protein BBP40_001268 [Aspergillus hancockii]|nr:hypothetical protein BBP40_001268 [Aspergillus hancockii]